MEKQHYDLVIIGGGPAGTAAAVYAARKRLHTLLIGAEFGGQSNVSDDIQNWIGTPHITGPNFAEMMRNHIKEYEGEYLKVMEGVWVTDITKDGNLFDVITDSGTFSTKTILIASGSGRRKLEVTGAKEFENKGITYCASCDGPLFADMDVAVIGGGNAALDTTAQLVAYVKSVALIYRGDAFTKADEITVEKVMAHPKVKVYLNTDILEIKGDKFVNSITIKNKANGETSELPVKGVFVEIGQIPNTGFVSKIITLDENGKIESDPWNQRTKVDGIWCAGDASNGLYHQNNIAAGDAVKALEDIYMWLHKNGHGK